VQPQPLATWRPAISAWETPETYICGHSVVFSETWPSSGMTLRGTAYALPTSAPRTDAGGSLSSPGLLGTPRTSMGNGVGDLENRRASGRLEGQIALLLTPTAQLAVNGGSQPPAKRKAGGHGPTLADQIEHL
jgi:hypothetical protein